MKKTLIIIIILLVLIPASSVFAHDPGSCTYVQPNNTELRAPGTYTFPDCTIYVHNQIGDGEGFGIWGDYAIYINDSEVYAGYENDHGQIIYQYWGTVPQPSSQQQAPVYEPLTLPEIFDLAEEDINDFWVAFFEEHNIDYVKPNLIVFDDRSIRTGCGDMSARVGPFYCSADHTMYFPEAFMVYQHERVGDYAVVIIIAHEWAHSVQAQLGLLGAVSIKKELQADCLAGAYSAYAANLSTKVIIEDGDFEEALSALFSFGDPDGTDWFDEQAHGSGDQRMASMRLGLDSEISACA